MQKLSWTVSAHARWSVDHQAHHYVNIVSKLLDAQSLTPLRLHGAKLYLMDDGRWLIMDYLNIPDAPRHYIDCIEGSVCNMNVRIISESTKLEIEKNQEIFNELT